MNAPTPATTPPSTTLPSTTLPSTTLPSTTVPSITVPSTTLPPADLPPGPLTTAELAAAVPVSVARERYRRIWHGVYRRGDQPDDLRLRSLALARTWPDGVLRGRSAALLWGDDSAPADAKPEIWLPSTRHTRPGRVYRYGALPTVAVTDLCGVRVTTPLRTCRDLAVDLPTEDAIVALDRMCARVPGLQGVLRAAAVHPSGRGAQRLTDVVRQLDPRSDSPDESRARLVLASAGLADEGLACVRPSGVEPGGVGPGGVVHGHEIHRGRRIVRPALTDPVARVAVEVRTGPPSDDGRTWDERAWAALREAGWTVLVVRGRPGPGGAPSRPDGDPAAQALSALRSRWPATERLDPVVGSDAAADPLGMWSAQS